MSDIPANPEGRADPNNLPSDGYLSDIKDVVDISKATLGIIRGTGTDVQADTFHIVITDVYSTANTTASSTNTLHVFVTVANVSRHGVYVEDVYLEQHQTRERSARPAVYKVYMPIKGGMGIDEKARNRLRDKPLHLPWNQTLDLRIDVDLQPDTWPAVDAYGLVGFRVTKLDQEAQRPRTMFFAIRR
jgi:hypothetical protein